MQAGLTDHPVDSPLRLRHHLCISEVELSEFPRLRIHAARLEARGSFAEAQATFLQPDLESVSQLDALLMRANAGIVAHFYMDPELQGVLSACTWPHIHVSDSLVMADRAVQMASAGVSAILVAGVDFMSENVRAVLDAAGFSAVPVYRLAKAAIGCSLAEAAQTDAYLAFLRKAAQTPRSLHVVYINTSLRTKAVAQQIVPTITCTSSNVVQTILQAAAQVDDLHVWYGPDTYMGHNLQTLLSAYAQLSVGEVQAIHPQHTPESIARLLERFHPFEQGHCIVHHLFGAQVVAQVRRDHASAFVTAHLEVPGEMFALATEYQQLGRGAVGSTSNLLDFIQAQVARLPGAPVGQPPAVAEFVLGTEAGMVTSIVRSVQHQLAVSAKNIAVDILFPVAADSLTQTGEAGLPVVPGPAAGEGCSMAGGCATCPYMKMNHLDGLQEVLRSIAAGLQGSDSERAAGRSRNSQDLLDLQPRMDKSPVGGQDAVQLGSIPILQMREFQRSGRIGAALVEAVCAT